MSLQDESDQESHEDARPQNDERENNSVANKLSDELNNWRRRRTSGRPQRTEGPRNSFQSDAARTIKVRGHETLVIRKPKVVNKAPGDAPEDPTDPTR
jgi:hypothetical protein